MLTFRGAGDESPRRYAPVGSHLPAHPAGVEHLPLQSTLMCGYLKSLFKNNNLLEKSLFEYKKAPVPYKGTRATRVATLIADNCLPLNRITVCSEKAYFIQLSTQGWIHRAQRSIHTIHRLSWH